MIEELFEQPFFAGLRAILCREHLVFPEFELRRDVTFGVLECLAPAIVFGHIFGLRTADFNKEPMHAVEFNAQCCNACACTFACFKFKQVGTVVRRDRTQGIEVGIKAICNHATITHHGGRFFGDGAHQ